MMNVDSTPRIVILAGPNGAGKTTSAKKLLQGVMGIDEFVNADVIAQGLSGFSPERVALTAGSIMLQRIQELASAGRSFAFETTLASRTFAPWLRECKHAGYRIDLVFLWLSSTDVAVERVAERVSRGGHDIPEETIRRRYQRGLSNFFSLYQPLADSWQMFDNGRQALRLVAFGGTDRPTKIKVRQTWSQVLKVAGIEER